MNAKTNKQRVQDFNAALSDKLHGADIDLGPFLAEDVVWWLPQSSEEIGVSQKHDGKKAALALLSGAVSDFYLTESIEFDYHSFIAEGDLVAVHLTLRAKTVNGKDYENHYQILYRCRDGLIAEVWESFDTAYLRGVFST